MSTLAVVIARMGSTRLPGKVLMNLKGGPVLGWVTHAARYAPFIDNVIVATSTLPADDAIEAFCKDKGVGLRCFRGSETDVLSRVAGAVRAVDGTTVVVRITADCPFIDPNVIGAVVRLQAQTKCAYASNVDPRTWPDGLDVEAFTVDALFAAEREASRPIDRECVTTWIARNRARFPAEALICPLPGLAKERWVLDTENDLKFCHKIAHRINMVQYPSNYLEILAILDREPELRAINAHHPVNERYYEALANEPIVPRSYERSQAQFARAQKTIPLAAQTFSKSHLQFPQPSPLFVTHGQGGVVWDADGNEYVDLVSALLPNVLGYRDPDVDQAIRSQLARGISFSLATDLEAQLAETLCRLIPCAEMVRFGKNGTDVTTAAVRLARATTGRDRVLICGGYHGWNDWSLAGTERARGVPADVAKLTTRIPFGDEVAARMEFNNQVITMPFEQMALTSYDGLLEIEKHLKKNWYAAVVVEPEGNPDYLRALRWLCTRYGALLIFDEVITGFRFALGGAQQYYGITPDLACFGKAMANGMPLSALVGRADIMRRMAPPDNIFYSGTFAGETLSLAASIATIAKLERENVIAKLWDVGGTLEGAARQLIDSHDLSGVIGTHGQSPLVRLAFHDQRVAALFRKEMIAAGVLIIASHNVCYAHGPNEMRRVLRAYDHALGVIHEAIMTGDLPPDSVAPTVRA